MIQTNKQTNKQQKSNFAPDPAGFAQVLPGWRTVITLALVKGGGLLWPVQVY